VLLMAARRAIGDILIGFLGAREFKASYPIADIIHSLHNQSIYTRVFSPAYRTHAGEL
jgi:hypothetical protein